MRAVWQRPSSLKDFWTLYEHALEAADRLAKFVCALRRRTPALNTCRGSTSGLRAAPISPVLREMLSASRSRSRFESLRDPHRAAASRSRTTPIGAAPAPACRRAPASGSTCCWRTGPRSSGFRRGRSTATASRIVSTSVAWPGSTETVIRGVPCVCTSIRLGWKPTSINHRFARSSVSRWANSRVTYPTIVTLLCFLDSRPPAAATQPRAMKAVIAPNSTSSILSES